MSPPLPLKMARTKPPTCSGFGDGPIAAARLDAWSYSARTPLMVVSACPGGAACQRQGCSGPGRVGNEEGWRDPTALHRELARPWHATEPVSAADRAGFCRLQFAVVNAGPASCGLRRWLILRIPSSSLPAGVRRGLVLQLGGPESRMDPGMERNATTAESNCGRTITAATARSQRAAATTTVHGY